jgi:methylmalonyl-CoA mutase N-terminal domain/subunit
MWARLMRDRFGAKDPRSWMLRFHTQTAGSTLAAQQIDVNVVRVTVQALAAVLGGTQSLHTNGRDEALALPTAESARLALRTQQVVAHESGVADELEADALRLIAEIDGMGGMVAAIEDGFPQREIQAAAYRAQLQIDRGEKVVVGVNKFQEAKGAVPPLLKVDPALEAEQVAGVRAWRAARDAASARARLDSLGEAASGADNVMPAILSAVEAGATLGEIADVLRRVFGEYKERPFL